VNTKSGGRKKIADGTREPAVGSLPHPGLPRDREATLALLGVFLAAFTPLCIEVVRLISGGNPSAGVLGLMAAFCLAALLINQYYLVRLTSAYVRRLDRVNAKLQLAGDYKAKAHRINSSVSYAFNELAIKRSEYDDFVFGVLTGTDLSGCG
jgi:hypothetical protein